ncbi:hypothetical protein GLOTRDRAFT_96272 [Gloeophyllum trabeum ATCC 11539]|uniref:Uncharacterized protein n=1 Tax=Gloeophyllum trabeum (strain ATCC 11539 / FP-39264 / Madison 617) TaxID=670483 RepID=S7RBC5_GLOTA|nr:uncharacterized protein GLOTRDRAFT_96272 [Gloeophyllum trabeum ATCC 11539]EPQ51520.1 hypothetical protein GLOTRDRAFT_96272 [Gloeophyllum trabeum ATCC 11539]
MASNAPTTNGFWLDVHTKSIASPYYGLALVSDWSRKNVPWYPARSLPPGESGGCHPHYPMGKHAATLFLGFKKGTTASALLGPRRWRRDARKGTVWGSMPFFFSRAVATTLEDVAVRSSRRSGVVANQHLARMLGHVSVFAWLSFYRVWQVQTAVNAGLRKTRAIRFSGVEIVLVATRCWQTFA